jgi:hypothetical protein
MGELHSSLGTAPIVYRVGMFQLAETKQILAFPSGHTQRITHHLTRRPRRSQKIGQKGQLAHIVGRS